MPDNSTLCAKYRSRRRQGVGSSSFVEGNYEEDYEFEDEDQSDGTQQQTLIQRKNYQYHCHTNNDNGAFPRCFGDVAATRHVSLSAENEKSLLSKNYRLAKEFVSIFSRHRNTKSTRTHYLPFHQITERTQSSTPRRIKIRNTVDNGKCE